MPHPTLPLPTLSAPSSPSLETLLTPLFEAAQESSSLVPTAHSVQVGTESFLLPHFLLLGERGGGRPVRIGLFSGLDAGSQASVYALSRLLLQYELSPSLARDFALFAYPVVNVHAFAATPRPLSHLEQRIATGQQDGDVRLFQGEFSKWNLDGLIFLREDPRAEGFHVAHRSAVIGHEVVEPALALLSRHLPVRAHARVVRPEDRLARLADQTHGRLSSLAPAPYPFEIELFAPGQQTEETQVTGTFLFVQEFLRQYRTFISHALHL